MTMPLHLDTDPPRWRQEIEELERMGEDVRRCSVHHVKIGDVNYYPSTGRIYIDPCIKYPNKGFKALLHVIEESKRAKQSGFNVLIL